MRVHQLDAGKKNEKKNYLTDIIARGGRLGRPLYRIIFTLFYTFFYSIIIFIPAKFWYRFKIFFNNVPNFYIHKNVSANLPRSPCRFNNLFSLNEYVLLIYCLYSQYRFFYIYKIRHWSILRNHI